MKNELNTKITNLKALSADPVALRHAINSLAPDELAVINKIVCDEWYNSPERKIEAALDDIRHGRTWNIE